MIAVTLGIVTHTHTHTHTIPALLIAALVAAWRERTHTTSAMLPG